MSKSGASVISAAISKKKKGEVPMEEALMKGVPQIETKKIDEEEVEEAASMKSLPVMKSSSQKPMKQPEANIEIELMLKGAKKKEAPKDKNAYEQDLGYFKVDKDEKGKFKETGESRAKYLRKVNQLKKK